MNMNPHFDRHITDEQAREAYERLWQDRSDKLLNAVPDYMHGGFYRWVMWGIWGGDFLDAVVTNDLMGAIRKADDDNRAALVEWAALFYNGAPAGCFGSEKLADRWATRGGILGRCTDCNGALAVPGIKDSERVDLDDGAICMKCAEQRANEKHAAQVMGD